MSSNSSKSALPVLDGINFHNRSVSESLSKLETTQDGLTKPDAASRLSHYGPNALTPAITRTIWMMIWEQLYNIITAILISAAIIAGIFHEWIELGFILAVVVANVAIGVVQEGRAQYRLDVVVSPQGGGATTVLTTATNTRANTSDEQAASAANVSTTSRPTTTPSSATTAAAASTRLNYPFTILQLAENEPLPPPPPPPPAP